MKIELELWHLITLLLMFLAAVWAFGKVLLAQIEKRLIEKFKAQEALREAGAKALREHIDRYIALGDKTAAQVATLERDFLKWQAELPVHYVRREDYVRGQSVIEAKLDALYDKLEVVQLKGASHVS